MKQLPNVIPDAAREHIRSGGPPPARLRADGIPPVAVSWGRTGVFKTGAWRNITPRYVRRLPPCRAGCPVGNDVEGWLEAAGAGRWAAAAGLLDLEQPLPSVCGRVCYHPCETVCNRGSYDGAVSIRAVERYLGDGLNRSGDVRTTGNGGPSGGRVRVVGSGPAGLAAAWLLVRLGHEVEVVERTPLPGGLLRYGIPPYRLPRAVLDAEIARMEALGILFRCGATLDVTGGLNGVKGDRDALFLAPGAAGHRSSGIRGAPPGVVVPAIEFLRNRENETLRLPDGSLEGKTVAVIGGGNSAVDAARTSLRLGGRVTVIYRRTRTEMPAYSGETEAALEEGVGLELLASPREYIPGSCELKCIRNRLGKPDESGRRRPEPVPGSEFTLPADLVLDAVGETVEPAELTPDAVEREALVKGDVWGRTPLDGVFIGGDFTGAGRTVASAIGSGKRAALAIDAALRGDGRPLEDFLLGGNGGVSAAAYFGAAEARRYDDGGAVEFAELNSAYFTPVSRRVQRELPPAARAAGFAEVTATPAMRTVRAEAGRCFHCGSCDLCGNCHVFCPDGAVRRDPANGALSFDLEHCKGCGVCAAECPRAAIAMSG